MFDPKKYYFYFFPIVPATNSHPLPVFQPRLMSYCNKSANTQAQSIPPQAVNTDTLAGPQHILLKTTSIPHRQWKYNVSHSTLMSTVLSFPDKLGTEARGELCACSNIIHRASGSTHNLLSWTVCTSCPTDKMWPLTVLVMWILSHICTHGCTHILVLLSLAFNSI